MALPRTSGRSKTGYAVSKYTKLGNHEAEIEKIKNEFLAILRDIMGDIDSGKRSRETATAPCLRSCRKR